MNFSVRKTNFIIKRRKKPFYYFSAMEILPCTIFYSISSNFSRFGKYFTTIASNFSSFRKYFTSIASNFSRFRKYFTSIVSN